ncbi:MAG: PAS domain-containing protein [Patescibacteria group bacterium]|nr:PAS domain-containing protein [Patescibacteria group bacterium]MCL5261834.1 PAS domain-containing protein [Patescibacteria group bacterium]
MAEAINGASFLREILNVIPDPVFVKDKNHAFVFVNRAYADFFGYPVDEIIGKTDRDLYLEREVAVFWENDSEVLKTGQVNTNEETYTDKSKKTHIILTRKARYIDKNGMIFVVGTVRDVTRERVTEKAVVARTQELERINRLMVDRENKMLELKHELALLKKKLSR